MRPCPYFRQVCRRADGKCRFAKPVNGLPEWERFAENVQRCLDGGPPIPLWERVQIRGQRKGRIRMDAEEWVRDYEKKRPKGAW